MKKTIIILMLLFSVKAFAQTAALPVYACVQNGTQAVTSGLKSSNYQLGVVPYCSVSVYLTGTTTIATTTPQSPFRANKDGSIPPIYAAVNQGYDVVLSGGISPNTYPSPVTLTDLFPSINFSGAGNLSGTLATGYIPVATGAHALGNSAIDQDVTTPGAVTVTGKGLIVNAQAGTEQVQFLTGTGSGAPTMYNQTANGIDIGLGSDGLSLHSMGAGGTTFAAFNGTGQVVFNNSTTDGSAPVQINTNTGTCDQITPDTGVETPYNCGFKVNAGSEFNSPVEINAALGVTGGIIANERISTTGSLQLMEESLGAVPTPSTGYVQISAPSSVTAYNIFLPGAQGAGALTNDGSGNLSWNGGVITNPMTTLGDTLYGGSSGTPTRLAGNTTATKQFLMQTGDGTISAAPAWGALVSGDIPDNAASTTGNAATATYATSAGSSPASALTVGTTTISSGTSGYIPYDNAGVLGELATTGTGSVVLSASPALTGTPTAPTATTGTSTTQIATTAFVASAVGNYTQLTPAYWHISNTVFATSTMLGPVYYTSFTSTTVPTVVARLSGTISCTVAPVINLMDLGTSPTTTYASATSLGSLTTGTADGVYGSASTTMGSTATTATHYYGIAFSAGTCVTAPTFDIAIISVW